MITEVTAAEAALALNPRNDGANVVPASSPKDSENPKTLELFHCVYPDCVYKTRCSKSYTNHVKLHKRYGRFKHSCSTSGCRRTFPTLLSLAGHKAHCRGTARAARSDDSGSQRDNNEKTIDKTNNNSAAREAVVSIPTETEPSPAVEAHHAVEDAQINDESVVSCTAEVQQFLWPSEIPPGSTFACTLCDFVGLTLESAVAHAVTHACASAK